MEYTKYKLRDICIKKGFVRGPFGSALKKSLFVSKGEDTYKVYEQCVPLEQNKYGGHYYITGDYFRNSLSRFEVRHNDFLVSCSGVNYGAIYHLQEPFEKGVINQALLIIRIDDTIVDYNYFKYLFRVVLSKAITTGTGDSTIPNFPSLEVIKDVDVYLPPLDIQKKAGEILNTIENQIQMNNRVNDNLQQQLKLLYDYWFTQFDFPDENGKPYKSSGGSMTRPNGAPYTIPTGWKVESVYKNTLTSIIKPGVEPFVAKTYLATGEVNGTNISTGSLVEYATRESRANMQPSENSVWFAKMKNSIKHLFLNSHMKQIIDSSILSTGFCGLQCSTLSFEYIASFIEHSYFETIKDTLAHGATQEAVNNDDLAGIALVIPPERVIMEYHELTKGSYAQISQNICENQALTQLRDWLLPMLMNGQATISD